MALVTIEAGAQVELLTRSELRAELARANDRARPSLKRRVGSGSMPSSGNLIVRLDAPPAGKIWDLRRLVVAPADVAAAALTTARAIVFVGSPPANPASLDVMQSIEATEGLPATFYWTDGQCPVQGSEAIWVAILAGPTAATIFSVVAHVIENTEHRPEDRTHT
jgi:hypothetical protein